MIETVVNHNVATIEIQRDKRRNALNRDLCAAIRNEVTQAAGSARIIVITGQGSAFCAGADLDGVYNEEFRSELYGMLETIRITPVPVVAAVNGPAIGAGTQLAMSCDVRVADATAQFGIPTARNAMAVDAWTIRRLRELVGAGVASQMMLMAEILDADQACNVGLVDKRGDLGDAIDVATRMSEFAPLAMGYAKMVLHDSGDDVRINEEFSQIWDSHDVTEAQQARAQKRPPQFIGR